MDIDIENQISPILNTNPYEWQEHMSLSNQIEVGWRDYMEWSAEPTGVFEHVENETGTTRHKSLSDNEWQRIKRPFSKLYQDDGLDLDTVMAIMRDQYGFSATKPMYKKRIDLWGLSKSWTNEEKLRWGRRAERLIAEGRQLPAEDEAGKRIPWNRVRRSYGRQKIPSKYLPAMSRQSKKPAADERDHTINTINTQGFTYWTSGSSRQNIKPHQPPSHPQPGSSVTMGGFLCKYSLEESVGHLTLSWVRWCSSTEGKKMVRTLIGLAQVYERTSTTEVHLLSPIERFMYFSKIAESIQKFLQCRSYSTLLVVLSFWVEFQHPAVEAHGILLRSYIMKSSTEILGASNPLCQIFRVLHNMSSTIPTAAYRQQVSMAWDIVIRIMVD